MHHLLIIVFLHNFLWLFLAQSFARSFFCRLSLSFSLYDSNVLIFCWKIFVLQSEAITYHIWSMCIAKEWRNCNVSMIRCMRPTVANVNDHIVPMASSWTCNFSLHLFVHIIFFFTLYFFFFLSSSYPFWRGKSSFRMLHKAHAVTCARVHFEKCWLANR